MKIAQQGENVEQIRSLVIEEAKRLAEEDIKITKQWVSTVLNYSLVMIQ